MTRVRSLTASIVALAAFLGAPEIARAQDIDQCISASEKAVALRKAGKLIEARASLSRCSASTCPEAVSTSCQQRLGDVIQAIPSIVFTAKDGSGHDLAAVKLSVDGAAYSDHLDGTVMELDPGQHDFRFEVAGQAPVVQHFVLNESEHNRRERIVIGGVPIVAGQAADAQGESVGGKSSPGASADQPSGSSAQRTAALVVVGVGAAGLVAGAIFGALSVSAHSSYEKDCGSSIGAPPGYCDAQGVSGQSDAANKGTLATVFFVAGGVAAAAGGIWYFLAPKGGDGVQVGAGPGGISVKGSF
jgi:hypothetical protein